ncbi:MAG: hypothetical protein ABFR32_02895 [Bacteroidota bacterium]
MKKLFLLLFLFFTFSCDDGDFNISSFEFEDTVNMCITDIYTLYRLSDNGHKEALIVTLTDDQIKNSIEPVLPVNVTETGTYTVTDRIFNDEVTKSYFCSIIPPTTPKVTKDWRGVSGTIEVINKAVLDENEIDTIAYEHVIILHDVVLKSGEESLIFNDTYLFGSFQTGI